MTDVHDIRLIGGPADGEKLANVAGRISVDDCHYRLYRVDHVESEDADGIEYVLVAEGHPPLDGASPSSRIWL